MTETSIGLAGVRVILKRAMHEIGIKMKPDVPNDELVRIVIEWDAPVAEMCDRWIMIAGSKSTVARPQQHIISFDPRHVAAHIGPVDLALLPAEWAWLPIVPMQGRVFVGRIVRVQDHLQEAGGLEL